MCPQVPRRSERPIFNSGLKESLKNCKKHEFIVKTNRHRREREIERDLKGGRERSHVETMHTVRASKNNRKPNQMYKPFNQRIYLGYVYIPRKL